MEPSIAATLGEQHFGSYIGVAFIEGLFCTQTVHLGPGCLAVIITVGLYSGVAVKRGSTVPLFMGKTYELAHLLCRNLLPRALKQFWCHEAWCPGWVVPYPQGLSSGQLADTIVG